VLCASTSAIVILRPVVIAFGTAFFSCSEKSDPIACVHSPAPATACQDCTHMLPGPLACQVPISLWHALISLWHALKTLVCLQTFDKQWYT
jgi:hypothetical protein